MSKRPARLALLAALALLPGCKVDQDKEVALYRRELDGPAPRPKATLAPG